MEQAAVIVHKPSRHPVVLKKKLRKIILIEPASTHIHVYSKWPIPRLGCILLGAVAKALGYEVRVYVEDIHPVDMNDVLTADLVGISVLTPTATQSYRLADRIRAASIPVVLGGIHPRFMPEEAIMHADYLLRGEAEDAWIQFLEFLAGKCDPRIIPGLSYWDGGEPCHNSSVALPVDMNRFLPDPEIVVGWNSTPVFSINTRRGCPFDCDFCTVWKFNGRKVRCHSIDYVREVLKIAKRRNAEYIFFNDDIFNLPEDFTLQVCEEAARITPQIPKNGQFRWEVAKSPELLAALKRANFENMCIGIESFSTEVLRGMRKKATSEHVVWAIQKIREWGFNIHGMFIAGAKGDTVQTIRQTPKTARKLGVSTFQMMIDTPLPGSDLAENRAKQGKQPLTTDWRWYDGHHAVWELETDDIHPAVLNEEAMKAVLKFYSLPARLYSLFKGDLRNWYMRGVGRDLIKKWWRDPRNLEYLRRLADGLPLPEAS